MPTTTNYIWDEDNLLAEADGTNAINAVYTNEPEQHGNLISSKLANTPSYHHFDAIGSTRQLTNIAGHVTDSLVYDAWGNVNARVGTTNIAFVWTGEVGYYYDREPNTFWIAVRPYDSVGGRWLSEDPAGFVDGLNKYLYVRNDPVNLTDPTGEAIFIPVILVGAGGQYCICAYHRRSWDKDFGARDTTPAEQKCIDKTFGYMPGFIQRTIAKCVSQNMSMGNNVNQPTTMCKALCFLPPYNYGAKTYLGANDVDCSSCHSVLNLAMTMIHECVHQRINCPDEVEAYDNAIRQFKFMKRACEQMVKDGVCKSVKECESTIDEIVKIDERQLERERRALEPVVVP